MQRDKTAASSSLFVLFSNQKKGSTLVTLFTCPVASVMKVFAETFKVAFTGPVLAAHVREL